MPLLQFSELFIGLIDCMIVFGSSFEAGDAADAPLLLTIERGRSCSRASGGNCTGLAVVGVSAHHSELMEVKAWL